MEASWRLLYDRLETKPFLAERLAVGEIESGPSLRPQLPVITRSLARGRGRCPIVTSVYLSHITLTCVARRACMTHQHHSEIYF